jgi:hypothetical protein
MESVSERPLRRVDIFSLATVRDFALPSSSPFF